MHSPVETRVIATGGVITATQINVRPSWVRWITVSPESLGTAGQIFIYDGFDRNGDLKWLLETGYGRHYNFIPPFKCNRGVYVYVDAAIASYTIAYKTHHDKKEPFKGENE